jgi:hypothetical protein
MKQIISLLIITILLNISTNAQSNLRFSKADALNEINDTLKVNKDAIIANKRNAPFYLITYCYAHKNKFKFKEETLDKLLDAYTKTRLIKNVKSRQDAELDYVFEYLDEHERDILFWLTCTDIYKDRPNYDYYKEFNVKK